MLDGNRRIIDYLRISVTDRCNLRCVYCMPAEGVEWLPHEKILRYEDILRLCAICAKLGVTKYKLTGGEPLVRKGLASLVAGIKAIPGTQSVTLTTNGILLAQQLPELAEAGLDGVNISLDTLDPDRFAAITRGGRVERVMEGLEAALAQPGLNVKLNCVPSEEDDRELVELAALAKDRPVAVRFIELMPIGLGQPARGRTEAQIRALLEGAYGPMEPYDGPMGNGPCHYVTLPGFAGKIGFISAMSHQFCARCNRVRLTATGFLKTCLQYETGVDLRALLDRDDETLAAAIAGAVLHKPAAHQFGTADVAHGEGRRMNEIGG